MEFYLAEIRINMSHNYRLVKGNSRADALEKLLKVYPEGCLITIQETL